MTSTVPSVRADSYQLQRQTYIQQIRELRKVLREDRNQESQLSQLKSELQEIKKSLRVLRRQQREERQEQLVKAREEMKKKRRIKLVSLKDVLLTTYGSEKVISVEQGKASFYADKFEGRTTASGQVFSNSALTAAHKTLPFGTQVRVINPANGQSVVVTINDRGPFVASRVIDLSTSAFSQLANLSRGVIEIRLEIFE